MAKHKRKTNGKGLPWVSKRPGWNARKIVVDTHNPNRADVRLRRFSWEAPWDTIRTGGLTS